jgi:predicted 2-oxoglutarate/Fe(II)-dependent dioxygenase YbiX
MSYSFLRTKLIDNESLKEINKLLIAVKDNDGDWKDGIETFKGDPDTKKNKELGNIFFKQKISDLIYKCLENNEEFNDFCFPKKIEDIMITKTEPGGYYNAHTDVGFNGQFSTTLFLSEPDSYEGGELCLYVDGEEKKIKLDPGYGITYPTGVPHRVNKVYSGTRLVSVFWTKSIFRDPTIREICQELCSIDLKSTDEKYIKSKPLFEEVISQNAFKLSNVLNKLIRTYGDI